MAQTSTVRRAWVFKVRTAEGEGILTVVRGWWELRWDSGERQSQHVSEPTTTKTRRYNPSDATLQREGMVELTRRNALSWLKHHRRQVVMELQDQPPLARERLLVRAAMAEWPS